MDFDKSNSVDGLSSLLRGKRFSRNTRRRSESFALLKDTRLILYIRSMIKRDDSMMPYVSHEFPQRVDVQSGQRGRKDRKRVVEGKRVSERVDVGGRGIIKKKNKNKSH